MKKLILSAAVIASMLAASCSDDDDIIVDEPINEEPTPEPEPEPEPETPADVSKTGLIDADETWTSDRIYVLNQKVVVDDGVTLTIEPGTIIKSSTGSGSLASALIVARGGKLMAEGTAEEPIIFTSTEDNIEVGQTAGTNLDQTDQGLWGGLIVLGKASSSFKGDVDEVQIEGIPADDTFGLYGGTVDDDNSGVLKYISIRHGGALIGEGNEINGLTLGGVGSGTVVENIEVVANVDDGIEWFGGTVDSKNLFVWACGDDSFDVDQAYSGTIDNVMTVLGSNSDHAFEIDGPEGSYLDSFVLKNATIVGNADTSGGEYADFRSNAQATVSNVYAYGFKADSDVELDNNQVAQNFLDGDLTFESWEIAGNDNSIFVEKVDSEASESQIILSPSFTERAANWTSEVNEGEQTVGAETSVFAWTYSNEKAGLGF